VAETFEEKVEVLRTTFFLLPLQADLTDIDSIEYLLLVGNSSNITSKEVLQAIYRLK